VGAAGAGLRAAAGFFGFFFAATSTKRTARFSRPATSSAMDMQSRYTGLCVPPRERSYSLRMTDEEWSLFESVAAHLALPVASMLRMLVKREYDALSPRATHPASRTNRP